MNKKITFFSLIAILSLLAACINKASLSRNDYTYLYDKNQKLIKPDFKIFHDQADSSLLYFQINSGDVLYGRINDTLQLANIWMKYYLWSDESKRNLLDSATHKLINYGYNETEKILQGKIRIKMPMSNTYLLELRFRDNNKDINVINNLFVDKRFNGNAQYYLLRNGKKILTAFIVSEKNNAVLEKSPLISNNRFKLNQFDYSHSMSPPPFVTASDEQVVPKNDTNSIIEFVADTFLLSSFRSVSEFFPITVSDAPPIYFYYFHENFPYVTRLEDMVQPLRYISTTSEYKKVSDAVNTKGALDNFWLKIAKNEDKAKKMIKEYYNRVEAANTYFSTHKEGWKTDRGIIYIVYGSPTSIYKSLERETWIYGEENNILSIKFEFENVKNHQSSNEFKLLRSPDFKNNWYRAVDLWRQGKIY